MNWQAVPAVLKVAVPLAVGGVLAGAIALGASGGNGGTPPAQQAAAETPTPVPEATAASSTPYVQDKTPVTPLLASQAGRSDCPAQWLAWREAPKGRFSVCYPDTVAGGIEAVTYPSAARIGDTVLWLHTPSTTDRDQTSIAFSITVSAGAGAALPRNGRDCPGLVPGQTSAGTRTSITLSGQTGESCQAVGQDFIQGRLRALGSIIVQIPIGKAGAEEYLIVVANYHAEPDKTESLRVVESIIGTLALY